jgi:hypothetical protein
MAGTLEDLMKDLEDVFAEIQGTQGVNGASGALTGSNNAYVKARLDQVEDVLIPNLRDGVDPSLIPADIGHVLQGYSPTLTFHYARDCAALASEAYVEAQQTDPDQQRIGDLVATIESLLPGFRTAAGTP